MKPQTADYRYRVMCLRIVPLTGAAIRLCQHPRDLTMSNGQVYQSSVGYEFTGYSATTSFSPSVVDLEGIAGFAGISKDAVASGVFDNARCLLFATTWNSPAEDEEPILLSILGKTTLTDDRYRIEEMAMVDVLNQSVGKTYTAACQKRFGSQGFAECKQVPVVATGTLSSVASQSTFTDTARTETEGFFTEGKIQFTGGLNAGLKPMEIKAHVAGGVFTTHEPFYYLPAAGDAYSVTEGCLKTLEACKSKGNVLNMGGDPFIPNSSQYLDRGLKN
jgi:uncharacterized phage protein (TIGR02218 family)